MRNFEERKAEILRRSEKRIKERKKNRKRILLGCVPLLVCMALLPAAFQPAVKGETNSDYHEDMPPHLDALPNEVVMVIIAKDDYVCKHTDLGKVKEIVQMIEKVSLAQEGAEEMPDNENVDVGGGTGYTVLLVDAAGNEKEYLLTEETLIVQPAGIEYRLTADEQAELKQVLGIPAE